MRKSLLSLFAILLLTSIALVGCGGGDDEGADNDADSGDGESVTWIANAVYPEDNHTTNALIDLADNVNEATDGEVDMDVAAGGALGYEGEELLSAVRDNDVPVSDILTSGVAGSESLFDIVTLPFLVHDFEEGKILNEVARPYFDEVVEEEWNQKLLYVIPWPFAGFWTQDKVESVDDMDGLQMRAYDDNGAAIVENTGGKPYPLPFDEVYSSLSTGVIDSVLTSTPTAVDAKFWEVLDYYSPVNATMATSFASVNLDEFNKLDEETQKIVLDEAEKIEEDIWDNIADLDKEQEEVSNENGIETIEPNEEFIGDLTELTEDVREDWLDSAPEEAQEIIDEYYDEIDR